MPYTLFVDEAGTFELTREGFMAHPPWIVGGVLIPGSREESERILSQDLDGVLAHLRTHEWFACFETLVHRTAIDLPGIPPEFRGHIADVARGLNDPLWLHRVSVKKAFQYFVRLGETDFFQYLGTLDDAIINCGLARSRPPTKLVAFQLRKPIAAEVANYAVLLQDLLLLGLNEIMNAAEQDHHFKLVVARRKVKDSQHNIHKLDKHFLSNAIVRGIASVDMIAAIDGLSEPVDLVSLGDSYGMVVADFVCGRARNTIEEAGEAAFKESLANQNIIHTQSSMELAQRQALYAESRGDYGQAILTHLFSQSMDGLEIRRLCHDLLQYSNESQLRHAIEFIIERFDQWAKRSSGATIVRAIGALFDAVDSAIESPVCVSLVPIAIDAVRLRVGAYALVWLNHFGDSSAARFLSEQLRLIQERVSVDAAAQEAVYQYELGVVEQAINDHDFDNAEAAAQRHRQSVLRFAGRPEAGEGTWWPRCHVRADCADLRASALSAVNKGDEAQTQLVVNLAQESFQRLASMDRAGRTSVRDDIIRLLQVLAYCAEAMGNTTHLLRIREELESIAGPESARLPYALALYCRASASLALLAPRDTKSAEPNDRFREAASAVCLAGVKEHPQELIVREWAILSQVLNGPTGSDARLAARALEHWSKRIDAESEVLRHQVRLARYVLNVAQHGSSQFSLNAAETMRAECFRSAGVSDANADLLAVRATTIY